MMAFDAKELALPKITAIGGLLAFATLVLHSFAILPREWTESELAWIAECVVLFWSVAYFISWLPFLESENHTRDIALLNNRIAGFEAEIKKLKDEANSCLKIIGFPCSISDVQNGFFIGVENVGGRTADDVEVELIELINCPRPPRLPRVVSTSKYTIHPSKHERFWLCDVSTNTKILEGKSYGVFFIHWRHMAHIDNTALVLNELLDVLSNPYYPNQEYRLHFKITARDREAKYVFLKFVVIGEGPSTRFNIEDLTL
jgi:hypothetical protein